MPAAAWVGEMRQERGRGAAKREREGERERSEWAQYAFACLRCRYGRTGGSVARNSNAGDDGTLFLRGGHGGTVRGGGARLFQRATAVLSQQSVEANQIIVMIIVTVMVTYISKGLLGCVPPPWCASTPPPFVAPPTRTL
eukprot:GHVU01069839.1.p1 GENE.GHVU01069839.1~~GHVU01069839.1.p1  ORF type:complete len:140 (+),score=10.82 GHVU01069839.1:222-641(+)